MYYNLYDQLVIYGCLKDLIYRLMLFGFEVDFVEYFVGFSYYQKKLVQLGDQDQQIVQVIFEGDMYRYLSQREVRIYGIFLVQEGEYQYFRDEEGVYYQEIYGDVVLRVFYLQLQNKERRF